MEAKDRRLIGSGSGRSRRHEASDSSLFGVQVARGGLQRGHSGLRGADSAVDAGQVESRVGLTQRGDR